MLIFTTKIKLTLILLHLAFMAFSQERDSVIHNYYKVSKASTLKLNLQHTELSILASENDSIEICTHIKVIPTNYNAPFAGITARTRQKDSSYIMVSILTGKNIQPHNALEVSCTISIPNGTHLNLNSRYGIINIKTLTGQIKANLNYINFTTEDLSSNYTHTISANYSTIKFNDLNNTLKITGKNTELTAKHLRKLETKTEFCVFNIQEIQSVKTDSYTDKFILGMVDSMVINSEQSLCHINRLNRFFQGEMNNGTLSLSNISSDFTAINIANSHVNTKLNFASQCHFSINADMRYCQLKQEQLTLQKIVSPSGTLYNGNYGNTENITSNLSLISTYGDVSIRFK